MNELFIIAGDYLKGKSVYPSIRRILNLLLNVSIASFVYENFYGSYKWLNYYDYKGILDFFIKGRFFIPFSIFIVVYSLTQFISVLAFTLLNHFKTIKITREILLYQFKKETIDEKLREITKVSKIVSPVRLTKNTMLEIYQELRVHLTSETLQEIENSLKEPKQNLEANFSLAIRIMIAITIYFISLPEFGWILFIIAFLVLITAMYVLIISYRFLDIIPTVMRKFHIQAEEYLRVHIELNNPNKNMTINQND